MKSDVKGRIDEHILITHERFDEQTALIGYYFEKCVGKDEYAKLETRVKKLEYALE